MQRGAKIKRILDAGPVDDTIFIKSSIFYYKNKLIYVI